MNLKEKLKTGFTTGTCAQAAAKASCIMLVTKKLIKRVEVETPTGIKLNLKLMEQKIGEDYAQCAIIKDAGDDIDVTDGVKIYARLSYSQIPGITIAGAEGVGRVTLPGLAVGVGEYAINPTPRRMIIKELTLYLTKDNQGLKVIISVPGGEELAKRTFNPRLGIVGGISIIGTTGIVEPKSLDAYKTSLSLQLDVLKAAGFKSATLVLGYVGERFAKQVLKVNPKTIIKVGDQVGFMLRECAQKKIKDVLLIGYIGKLIKLTRGQFNTHYQFGDHRIDTLADYAQEAGAKNKIIKEILKQATAEATLDIIRKNKLTSIFAKIAQDIVAKINTLVANELNISCILLSLRGEILYE